MSGGSSAVERILCRLHRIYILGSTAGGIHGNIPQSRQQTLKMQSTLSLGALSCRNACN